MSRKRSKSRGKKINPTYFVFCEGKTEEEYINLLKSEYRIPSIVIDTKIKVSDITSRYINSYKRSKTSHPKDKTFLFYDLDVPETLEKLKKIKNATLLVSNPCIELWFLLHYKTQQAETDCDHCSRELRNRNDRYKKGQIDNKLESKLIDKKADAIKRAKNLLPYLNPSTTVFRLIELLDNSIKRNG